MLLIREMDSKLSSSLRTWVNLFPVDSLLLSYVCSDVSSDISSDFSEKIQNKIIKIKSF